MPILDPEQQFYLASKINNQKNSSRYSFFLKFLPLASKYLRLNLLTLKSYAVFREDFLNSIDFLNEKYGLNIPSKEILEKKRIDDYFYFFYEKLSQNTVSSILKGEYYKITSKTSLHYYELFIDFSGTHRWYFTDSSFAILTLNSANAKKFEYFSYLIKLEADILNSIGLNLVLCAYINHYTPECLFILSLIKKGLFSEIHLSLDHDSSLNIAYFIEIIKNIRNLFSQKKSKDNPNLNHYNFYGYFYLYISYTSAIQGYIYDLKPLKKNPYFHRFFYSARLIECFTMPIQKIEKFLYCESGFKNESIRIILCQVPLYEGKYVDQYNSPCEVSKIECAYVRAIDFLRWKSTRVEVLLGDYSSKYVDFNDLHVIKQNLYINNMLLSMKKSQKSKTILDCIESEAKHLCEENNNTFKKQTIYSEWNEESIKKNLAYLSYALLTNKEEEEKIKIRQNQLFTVYESCISCLFNDKQSRKGVIYQVETGEGKSLIIQLIAALLALTKRSVHIATSNINLAKRDFADSFQFYEKLGIKSAVMLHKNELIEKSDNQVALQKIYDSQKEYYGDECFKNSLEMNFIVSGFQIGENKIKNDIKIIFSTVVHYEALYLKMMENLGEQNGEKYFKERSLIIDEADMILIDDITNGTILSRSIPSNSDEILTFVYQCKMSKLDMKNFKRLANYFIPSFKDQTNLKKLFKSYDALHIDQKAECNKEKIMSNASSILKFTLTSEFGIFSKDQLGNFLKALWPNQNEKNKIEMKKHYITKNCEMNELMNDFCLNFLTFICKIKIGILKADDILQVIQKLWPESHDLLPIDIELMFEEIDKVHSDKFFDGCKYKISKVNNEEGMKQKNKKVSKVIDSVSKVINYDDYLTEMIISDDKKDTEEDKKDKKKKKEKKKKDKDKDTKHGSSNDSEEEEEDYEMNSNCLYEVKPFDHENKGILEKNKEFGGFIQQFIAIKERINRKEKIKNFYKELNDLKDALNDEKQLTDFKLNKRKMTDLFKDLEQFSEIKPKKKDFNKLIGNPEKMKNFLNKEGKIEDIIRSQKKKMSIKIKDMSINYLYVAHPIFVQLYKNVCGFTGTIGNKNDKRIFKDYYELDTLKIPRNSPNKCVKLPIIICRDFEERNEKILDEILYFHFHKKPVLVIFQNLTEIYTIKGLLESKNITNINLFDGVDFDSPESLAGFDGSISLGSNFCGRGTNIDCKGNPLHVIVTYYSSNVRVIYQAYGRTARQNHEGTCRIICVKDQFLNPIEILTNGKIKDVVDKIRTKNKLQSEFINYYRERLPWLFSNLDENIKISKEIARSLKETHLNVNRIRAYTYKYPICMSIKSFLNIQSQKIFSLYNCPNCKYTWRIFKRYVREMILESWILNLDHVDNYEFENDPIFKSYSYEEYLKLIIDQVQEEINGYLLPNENSGNDILSVFINIHKNVVSNWHNKVYKLFNPPFNTPQQNISNFFLLYNFGIVPYTLYDESGVKVNGLDRKSVNNYIKDPELSYYRKQGANSRILASITEKIDDIFEQICQKFNDFIGGFTGLRFFLRRTIAGCEFGICLDLNVTFKDDVEIDPLCMIDTDPLFVLTIHTKSEVFVFAAILIIVLVYAVKICNLVFNSIEGIIKELFNQGIRYTLYKLVKLIRNSKLSNQINRVFNIFIDCLHKCLEKQIKNLLNFDSELGVTFANLAEVITRNEYEKIIDKLLEKIGACFTRKKVLGAVTNEIFPYIFKIGLLVFLCIAAFIMNFNCKKKRLKYGDYKNASNNYEVSVFKKKKYNEVKKSKEKLENFKNSIIEIGESDI